MPNDLPLDPFLHHHLDEVLSGSTQRYVHALDILSADYYLHFVLLLTSQKIPDRYDAEATAKERLIVFQSKQLPAFVLKKNPKS